jgi:tRNA uridine 5-carboxymethylaminomethyl modification enzyme
LNIYYPNGISTSLPIDVQYDFIHTIKGLENVKILRYGYGIEHDVVNPLQIYPTLETKIIGNLFLAGQINGTTGYEEAASQGLIAGINASLKIKNEKPLILERTKSYIGVLIDDLTTKGTNEPYRMFTSRVEYRLMIREDNADIRLREIGYKLGLVSKEEWERTKEKIENIEKLKKNS